MDLNETSFRGKQDFQFCFRVFRREFNFRETTITCWTRAKARVSFIFFVGVHRIPSPPRNVLKSIFASIVRARVRKLCGQANAQWFRN